MDEDCRIEAFEAYWPRIGGHGSHPPIGKAHVAVVTAFDLDDDRSTAADAKEKIRQRNDPLIAVLIGQPAELIGAERIDAAFRPHQTVEGKIVEHHSLAIFCALNIALDRVVLGDRGGGGGGSIFDQSALFGMKTPVRDRPRRQPVRRIYCPSGQAPAISNKASISMALSSGNSATPTVDLAWRPLSSKTSTMKSEAPLITAARLAKPGAALMKPPSLTQREILSRSPNAALACARIFMAHKRAAACPALLETSTPSLPVCAGSSLPFGPKASWPETARSEPKTTKGS